MRARRQLIPQEGILRKHGDHLHRRRHQLRPLQVGRRERDRERSPASSSSKADLGSKLVGRPRRGPRRRRPPRSDRRSRLRSSMRKGRALRRRPRRRIFSRRSWSGESSTWASGRSPRAASHGEETTAPAGLADTEQDGYRLVQDNYAFVAGRTPAVRLPHPRSRRRSVLRDYDVEHERRLHLDRRRPRARRAVPAPASEAACRRHLVGAARASVGGHVSRLRGLHDRRRATDARHRCLRRTPEPSTFDCVGLRTTSAELKSTRGNGSTFEVLDDTRGAGEFTALSRCEAGIWSCCGKAISRTSTPMRTRTSSRSMSLFPGKGRYRLYLQFKVDGTRENAPAC